LLAKSFG
jgi:hypothetical protein